MQFPFENQKGFKKFVAQIIDTFEDKVKVDCLRPKPTKLFPGFVYTYPHIRDNEGIVEKCNVLYKIDKPTACQRALKFNVHANDLL